MKKILSFDVGIKNLAYCLMCVDNKSILDWGILKLNPTLISEIKTNIKIDFISLIPNEYVDEFYSFVFGKKMIIVEKSYYDKFKTIKKMEYVIVDKITMNNGNQYTIISS